MSHIDKNQLDVSLPISREGMATEYFEDYLFDISKIATAVTDATASTVSVDSSDASNLATVITLANELKGDVNTLVTDLNNAITQVNALLANLRESDKLDE